MPEVPPEKEEETKTADPDAPKSVDFSDFKHDTNEPEEVKGVVSFPEVAQPFTWNVPPTKNTTTSIFASKPAATADVT